MKLKHLNLFFVMLLVMTSLTSCLPDGDETIALEDGNAKELIVRTKWRIKGWKGNPPSGLGWKIGDIFKFEDNDTFCKWPSDGKSHNWHWIINPQGGDTPVGIDIDNYDFGWESWGPGHWIIYYPYSNPDPTWIINFEDDPDTSEDQNVPDDPKDPEENTPTNIVSSITLKKNIYGEATSQTYSFSYDKDWRISKLVYANGSTKKAYNYAYSNGSIRITDESGKSLYEFSLDAEGRIKEAEYSNSYLRYFMDFETVKRDNHTWLCMVEKLGDRISEYTSDGKQLNNSNIDINCFIDGYSYWTPEWCRVLAPFGHLGSRMPYLINNVRIPDFDFYFTYNNFMHDDLGRVTSLQCDHMDSYSQRVYDIVYIDISYLFPTLDK